MSSVNIWSNKFLRIILGTSIVSLLTLEPSLFDLGNTRAPSYFGFDNVACSSDLRSPGFALLSPLLPISSVALHFLCVCPENMLFLHLILDCLPVFFPLLLCKTLLFASSLQSGRAILSFLSPELWIESLCNHLAICQAVIYLNWKDRALFSPVFTIIRCQ